ncbi:hypothetical protein ACRAWG_06405 [Methylobacterium sp. P31]
MGSDDAAKCPILDRRQIRCWFDVVVTLESGKVFRRTGCISRAEVEAWIEGLRVLMAAVGAPLSLADGVSRDASCHGSPATRDADQSAS